MTARVDGTHMTVRKDDAFSFTLPALAHLHAFSSAASVQSADSPRIASSLAGGGWQALLGTQLSVVVVVQLPTPTPQQRRGNPLNQRELTPYSPYTTYPAREP